MNNHVSITPYYMRTNNLESLQAALRACRVLMLAPSVKTITESGGHIYELTIPDLVYYREDTSIKEQHLGKVREIRLPASPVEYQAFCDCGWCGPTHASMLAAQDDKQAHYRGSGS